MEKVELTTYDEVVLRADLYLPEGQAQWAPGILVCHGFGSSKESHAPFGEWAAGQGYAVLIMDLRGHGESGGELDGNVFNDVAAGLSYLQSRPEVNPTSITIRGSSMGGWLAIHTAAHLADLSVVVAFCPANELLMTNLAEEAGMVQRGHPSPLLDSLGEKVPRVNVNSLMQLLLRLDVSRAARRLHPRPLLLVHCEGDQVVLPHISQKIYDTAAEPKALWLLPGGDHEFAQHDQATNQRVLAWIGDQQSA